MSEQRNSDNKPNSAKGNQGKKFPGGPRFNFNFYWIYGIIIVVLIITQLLHWGTEERQTSIDDFEKNMLEQRDVKKLRSLIRSLIHQERFFACKRKIQRPSIQKLSTSRQRWPALPQSHGPTDLFVKKIDEVQKDFPESEKVSIEYNQETGGYLEFLLNWIIPGVFLIVIWMFLMRRMGGGGGGSQIFNIGKSKAQLFDKDLQVKVTFNDVAGLEEAKLEVMEIVDFLKNQKYTTLGGKIPRGASVGPPGTR